MGHSIRPDIQRNGENMNWFAIILIVMQTCAAVQYVYQGKGLVGLLFLLYAAANVVLYKIGEL